MEKTRVAIIDLGTNTFNLLITEVEGSSYRILTESKYPAKLGKGGIHKATITPEAMKRGLEALTSHLITISEYQVESIFCFATSAIRSATNGAEFVKKVKQELGLTIRVIPDRKSTRLNSSHVRISYAVFCLKKKKKKKR